VAALAGDWSAARDVRLDLPETGVCNSNPIPGNDTIATDGACCGAAPSVAAPAPPALITIGAQPAEEQTGSCC